MSETVPLLTGDPLKVTARPMGAVDRRLILLIAMLLFVPGFSLIVTIFVGDVLVDPAATFDGYSFFAVSSAVIGTLGTILIWRKFVLWTFGRRPLTVMVGLIPFAQVIYPYPLWSNPGCGTDDVLRLGQHSVGAGLWVWLTIWVWWGVERRTMGASAEITRTRGDILRTHRSIIASVGYVPFIFGLFIMVNVALESFCGVGMNTGWESAMTYGIAAVPAIVVWIALWRGRVSKDTPFLAPALGKSVVCLGLPILLLVWTPSPPNPTLYQVFWVLPLLGWGAWMVWTAWNWQFLPDEGTGPEATPCCPSCGYSLNGLRWTRCPECGDEPTLDELWRATARQDL